MSSNALSLMAGAIMLARTRRDRRLIDRPFEVLKEHLNQALGA